RDRTRSIRQSAARRRGRKTKESEPGAGRTKNKRSEDSWMEECRLRRGIFFHWFEHFWPRARGAANSRQRDVEYLVFGTDRELGCLFFWSRIWGYKNVICQTGEFSAALTS